MILKILVFEAYDGGSHGQFLNGLIAHSTHEYIRLGLPPRKWKWRMRGSAIYFARNVSQLLAENHLQPNDIDLIFTSDMTSVADLRALLPEPLKSTPLVCYFHENQLTYPLEDESLRDYQYGFTNITSCLTADAAWFNSRYHCESFLQAVEDLLKKMPDFVPDKITETIRQNCQVMLLGLEPDLFASAPLSPQRHPPTVLWNHRWEYDKNPDDFFETLFDLQRSGVDFRLIVAGQSFRQSPPNFDAAKKILSNQLTHFGYAADRRSYIGLLRSSDIIVSTSIHEFFGLSVLEGIASGCRPLVPARLSYPELLPPEVHAQFLYNSKDELRDQLISFCRELPNLPTILQEKVAQLSWTNLAKHYDKAFERMT